MLCQVEQYGMVTYQDGLDLQGERIAQHKAQEIPDTLILLEHPHVFTLGRNARRENLLVSPDWLQKAGVQLFETDRGGDITYHGPGQLVGYPIFDLTRHRRDIAWYMRSVEEALIRLAADYGIKAARIPGVTGVWLGNEKLAALGVHVSRWITSHGFALNVNTDLRYFRWIVPCGIPDKGVTSLRRLLGRKVSMQEVRERVIEHFSAVFGLEMEAKPQPAGVLDHHEEV
ncbi:MAG TPA: lipoyl(octanoyl) transferase LipB [Terriglobia bacterium]|nr:lipoyl(octanoyl) transferase LipB [Terriglobia bacterium]